MSEDIQTQAGNGAGGPRATESTVREERLSRRRFLTASATIGAVLALPATPAAPAGSATTDADLYICMPGSAEPDTIGVQPAAFTEGAPLLEPEVRRAVNGELRTTLR